MCGGERGKQRKRGRTKTDRKTERERGSLLWREHKEDLKLTSGYEGEGGGRGSRLKNTTRMHVK